MELSIYYAGRDRRTNKIEMYCLYTGSCMARGTAPFITSLVVTTMGVRVQTTLNIFSSSLYIYHHMCICAHNLIQRNVGRMSRKHKITLSRWSLLSGLFTYLQYFQCIKYIKYIHHVYISSVRCCNKYCT